MEEWRLIPGFNGYLCSSYGRFKSPYGNILKTFLHTKGPLSGYVTIGIWQRGQNTTKHFKAHRLVAITFIDNLDNKPEVNHINGIKNDNRIENLEWVTRKENIRHAFKTGLNVANRGVKCGQSKFSTIDIIVIREALSLGFSISSYFKVHFTTINRIRLKETYGCI